MWSANRYDYGTAEEAAGVAATLRDAGHPCTHKAGQCSIFTNAPASAVTAARDAVHKDKHVTPATVTGAAPKTPNVCEDCVKMGGQHWLHLRLCLECGHVGCCNSSPNQHATKHFHTTGHPVMRSFEPGEDWGYCYVDDAQLTPAPRTAGEHGPLSHHGPQPPENMMTPEDF